MKIISASIIVMLCAAACITVSNYTTEYRPRADQKKWPDEKEVINTVVKCVRMADYASLRTRAVREYALALRRWYAHVSMGGKDVDAGVRALNYVHKIHGDAHGGNELWRDALDLSRVHSDPHCDTGVPGIPPPLDYQ